MRPYYAGEAVTLYLGDCREITGWLAADVLVSDPPYGRAAFGIDGSNRTVGRTYCRANNGSPIVGDQDTGTRDAALTSWGQRPAVLFGDLRIPVPAGNPASPHLPEAARCGLALDGRIPARRGGDLPAQAPVRFRRPEQRDQNRRPESWRFGRG